MSDLQNKSSQNYFTVFQFLNPNGITEQGSITDPVFNWKSMIYAIIRMENERRLVEYFCGFLLIYAVIFIKFSTSVLPLFILRSV